MKVISAVATTVGLLATAEANAEHVQRQLVLGGSTVPMGSKTYTAGIRETPEGKSYCGATLVSPTHVLTTAACTGVGFGVPNYVAVGTHYISGTQDGEQIKVVKVQNHTLYNDTSASYDFALLTLEKASKFSPIKLPAVDGSDIKPGYWTTFMGWGDTTYPNGTDSYELQKVGMEVWSNEDCATMFVVDDSMVCAGGAAGKDSCIGDTGGPLIKELNPGDADDVLIGLSSWGSGCGQQGVPAIYSRVATAVEWISSVVKGQ